MFLCAFLTNFHLFETFFLQMYLKLERYDISQEIEDIKSTKVEAAKRHFHILFSWQCNSQNWIEFKHLRYLLQLTVQLLLTFTDGNIFWTIMSILSSLLFFVKHSQLVSHVRTWAIQIWTYYPSWSFSFGGGNYCKTITSILPLINVHHSKPCGCKHIGGPKG